MSDPRRLLVATSDTHAGATTAPMRKPVEMDDGPTVHPHQLQVELADKMQRAADWCAAEARRHGSAGSDVQSSIPVVLLHNGDLVEGIHHRSHQAIVPELMGPQMEVAEDLLSIFHDTLSPVAWLFTRGTESHVGKGASFEEAVAKALAGKGFPVIASPDTGRLTSWYWEIDLGGHVVWAAHHGKVGRTPATKGSQATLFAAHVAFQELLDNWYRERRGEERRPMPRLLIGSHHHQKAESGTQFPVATIQLPCWTFRNSFAHKVAAFSREDIGLAAVYCDPDEPSPIVRWWDWQPHRSNRIAL